VSKTYAIDTCERDSSSTETALRGKIKLAWLNWDGMTAEGKWVQPSNLREDAKSWTYLAGNREKWQELIGESRKIDEKAARLVEKIGLHEGLRQVLAQARIIEVTIQSSLEERAWELEIMPWEFLIVRALRPFISKTRTPVVVRHLQTQDRPTAREIKRLLGVWSCPRESPFRSSYERELKLVETILAANNRAEFVALADANRRDVEEAISAAPNGGFDAIHFLSIESTGPGKGSFLWLPDSEGGNACAFEDAARLLTDNGNKRPCLVVHGFCSSGTQLSALTVANGAHAAIGFQDIVTDAQCENFFWRFYDVWQNCGWHVLSAFERALRDVAPMLREAGVILWTDSSLLKTLAGSADATYDEHDIQFGAYMIWQSRRESNSQGDEESDWAEAEQRLQNEGRRMKSVEVPDETRGAYVAVAPTMLTTSVVQPARERLKVDVKPIDRVNYAVLHNQQVFADLHDHVDPRPYRRSLFKEFQLRRLLPGSDLLHVDVEVKLYAGDHVGSWRQRLELHQTTTELADQIHVPLTSVLARSLHESLRTTIETTVKIGDEIVDHRTHPVSLLAIEEWLDDGICHVWLPSFVLPRDPAVGEIVQHARRFLCGLTDDFTAGFDGYQAESPERVDQQVRALWTTLSLDWQLAYINPPPSFTRQSQRLRAPSDVLRHASGTCVDLALLLAACIEFVDIRPVIILAPGHAFAGWWRNREGQVSFADDVAPEVSASFDRPGAGLSFVSGASIAGDKGDFREHRRASPPWTKGKETHSAIIKAVEREDLAVIETTCLTRHASFAKARHEGRQRLRSRLNFECMIDIQSARTFNITPLPLCS